MYWTCRNLPPDRPHFRWTFQVDLTALSPEDVGVPPCALARLRSLASDARAAPALCRRLAAVQRPRLAPPGQARSVPDPQMATAPCPPPGSMVPFPTAGCRADRRAEAQRGPVIRPGSRSRTAGGSPAEVGTQVLRRFCGSHWVPILALPLLAVILTIPQL